MKKIYFSALMLCCLLFAGCSKDFLKSYDDRIIGTWRITDIDKFGIGGSISNLPFKEDGSFVFSRDGSLTYTTPSGSVFKGTWNIEKKIMDSGDDDEVYRSLQITAVNFTTQEVFGEYYDDINFVGTNHIKAWIHSGSRSFVTHLKR